MSLSREEIRGILSAANISEEYMDQTVIRIAEANTNSLEGLQDKVRELRRSLKEAEDTAERYKADAEKLPAVQKELDKLQRVQSKEDPLEAKYNSLKAEFDKYKTDIETEKTTAKKQTAYRNLLKEAGVSDKRLESVMKVSGAAIDGLKFGEDGKIADADKLTETIKTEWADFITTEGTKGADTPTPPANNGGTLKQPSRAAQLAAQYHNNLYGENKKEG